MVLYLIRGQVADLSVEEFYLREEPYSLDVEAELMRRVQALGLTMIRSSDASSEVIQAVESLEVHVADRRGEGATRKIVINACFGGFSLSKAAEERIPKSWKGERDDPYLVCVVEELGEASNGPVAKLKVVEIPKDVEWEIDENGGWEVVVEKHRMWS